MSNGYKGNNPRHNNPRNFNNNNQHQTLEKIDFSNSTPDEIVKTAEKNAKNWKNGFRDITITQVRKYFNAIKQIELKTKDLKDTDKVKTELIYLKPMLAYQSGRAKNPRATEPFFKHLIDTIDNTVENFNSEKFTKFIKYSEALISYYKFYGGRD